MALLLVAFSCLVAISAAVTFWGIATQNKDALVINLAGRQRMLTQQMTWLALAEPNSPELETSIRRFDQTLHALREGGQTQDAVGNLVVLPPVPNTALKVQLDEVLETWDDFRSHLRPVYAPALQREAPLILDKLDAVVSAYEVDAQEKVVRLRSIQVVFVVAALLLLVWGTRMTRRRIIQPLTILGGTARRLGRGNLSESVPSMGDDELGDLALAFEGMRVELASSHDLLETRVTRRTRELAIAFELSQEIVAQLDLDHVLNSVTERARLLMGAQATSLCLLTPDNDYLELVSSSEEATDNIGLRQPIQHGLAHQVIRANETVVTDSACSNCGFLREFMPGNCVATPLSIGKHTLGALCVVRNHRKPIDTEETRALTLLANSAAIAITNARLAELGRYQAEQMAALAERERLAANLHDDLAQTLSFLNIKLDRTQEILAVGEVADAASELGRMKPAVEKAYRQVRDALIGLVQPATEDDMAENLAACVEDFRQNAGVSADLTITDGATLTLSPVVQTQALYIVREALANVRQHAQASHVQIQVQRDNGITQFTVEDNGRGFDPALIEGDEHLGLTIMQTRAERSGGDLVVDSTCGAGTRINARFPIEKRGSQHPGVTS